MEKKYKKLVQRYHLVKFGWFLHHALIAGLVGIGLIEISDLLYSLSSGNGNLFWGEPFLTILASLMLAVVLLLNLTLTLVGEKLKNDCRKYRKELDSHTPHLMQREQDGALIKMILELGL